jgi:hypothetical protein
MADHATSGGSSPEISWSVVFLVLALALIFGIVVTTTSPARDTAQAAPSNRAEPQKTPTAPTGKSWKSQGANAQCEGKPKFKPFTCISPTTGRTATCYCD